MEKKYKLTDETIEHCGRVLYRIEALRDFGEIEKGDKGGFVENGSNLSHEGTCWIYDNAKVFDNARVYEEAHIYGDAQVGDDAEVYGCAAVFDDAEIADWAKVYGHAEIKNNSIVQAQAQVYGYAYIGDYSYITDYAEVYGYACISGNAFIKDNVQVYDNAHIRGGAYLSCNTRVYEKAIVENNAAITGDSEIYGNVEVSGKANIHSAKVKDKNDYIVFKNWWSSGRYFTWTRSNNMWQVGCFYGTGKELIDKAYRDSEISGREYERVVRYVESINQPINRLNFIQRIICKLFKIK